MVDGGIRYDDDCNTEFTKKAGTEKVVGASEVRDKDWQGTLNFYE